MKRIARTVLLGCLGAVTLLTGCTAAGSGPAEGALATAGPTATSTAAPDTAVKVAQRYRSSGGASEVYGIQPSSGPGGVPLVIVWTHNADSGARIFDELKGSITGFLKRDEGLSLKRGYLMDVFGPDGSLQHRLDARV